MSGLAALSAVWVAGLIYALVCRPLATEDLWWHIKMGEVYFTQGLWPASDPLLHTSSAAPIQHEWLFGVLVYLVSNALGLFALRVLHGALLTAVIALIITLARRATDSFAAVALSLIVFLGLSEGRLMQLRPDMPTMVFAFALAALTWAHPMPVTVRRGALACAALLVWANMHSLFAVGLGLLAAATVGALVEDRSGAVGPPHAKPLALTLLAGFLITLLNPRGLDQHLTFFLSSKHSAIWSVPDEWTPFDPFDRHFTSKVTLFSWLFTNLTCLGFAAAFIVNYARFKRSPSPQTLDALAPRLFLPAAAALASVFVSFRFLWLVVLPFLYVVRSARSSKYRFEPFIALACAALAASFIATSGWGNFMGDTPSVREGYFSKAYNDQRYPDPGVFFLRDTQVTGNLFNHYTLGGYFEYRLAPRLKAFIDGRTEHYTAQVKTDSHRIMNGGQAERLALLDAYGVNVFFAYGGEYNPYPSRQDTLRLMKDAPGWVLVFRSFDHAVYLRQSPQNEENLRRIATYFANIGIDFDATTGFRVDQVLAKAPRWAVEQRLVSADYEQLVLEATSGAAPAREAARRRLFKLYAALDDRPDLDALRTTDKTLK